MICLCHSIVWHNLLFGVTTNITEATERTRSKHRAGIASEASGQCEGFAKCERTTELPQNVETGAPRADTNDGEKAGANLSKVLK